MTETLVCLSNLHVEALNLSEGFTQLSPEAIERMFDPSQIWLGPREALETDERYRQLVSYVVVRHGDQVLTYRRTPKGGESRLHGRVSVGVGGHWNVGDVFSTDGAIDAMATLRRAFDRELAEEIGTSTPERVQVVGVIKESGNAVSRVHLGVVIECWLPDTEVVVHDPGLIDPKFVARTDLSRMSDNMETWSSGLIAYLNS